MTSNSDATVRTDWRIRRAEMVAPHAAVAAKRPVVAEIGLEVLRGGGNAVDAAAAMAFAIGVVEPFMSGLASSGFITIALAGAEPLVVDYFGRAPHAARPDMYELVGGGTQDVLGFRGVKDEANFIGHRAVAVPGMPAGMALALERHGTRSWSSLLEPAIALAGDGFDADWHFCLASAHTLGLLRRFPETASIFTNDGLPWCSEDSARPRRVVQRDLAATLRRMAEQGPREFYQGETARLIAADMRASGGLIDEADLAAYRPREIAALRIDYRGRRLLGLPGGSGGPTVAEALNILSGYDLAALGHGSAQAVHLIAEASRLAFADRYAYLGDEQFVEVDWEYLVSDEYADERRAAIDPERALAQAAPGPLREGSSGPPRARGTEGCTTHFAAIDADRTVVSVTQTLTGLWGSGVVSPGTGVVLNNAMNLFDPLPGRPNSIAPDKRPLSSMAHFIALGPGGSALSVGAPGGRRIMGTVMQTLMAMLDFRLDPQTACSGPYVDCSGPELWASERLGPAVLEDLRQRGHRVSVAADTFWPLPFASPMALSLDESGLIHGGADPWYVGIAAGY